jgi:hypothetical protein
VTNQALPRGIRQARVEYVQLAQLFKQLNAPLGSVGRNSLVFANRSVTGNETDPDRRSETAGARRRSVRKELTAVDPASPKATSFAPRGVSRGALFQSVVF